MLLISSLVYRQRSKAQPKPDNLYQRINGVISFVAENPVRAVASHTQAWLSRWYKDVSALLPLRIGGAGSHKYESVSNSN